MYTCRVYNYVHVYVYVYMPWFLYNTSVDCANPYFAPNTYMMCFIMNAEVYYIYNIIYIFKNGKKSRDATAKKNRYKRNRDKQYEEIYIPPYNHTH